MPRKQGTSVLISAAVFLALEAASVMMLHSSSTLQNIWINRASHRVSVYLWGVSTRVGSYFNLSSRNKLLEGENAALSEELRKYRSIEKSERYLQSLQDYDDGFDYTLARIVKMSTGAQRNYIVIDKGIRDGIDVDCGIVTAEGVVGVVDAVDYDLAYGRTLMNPNMSVSVRIGHTGLTGPLSWSGIDRRDAIMEGIPLGYAAEPGDTVWTSGYSAIFPPDIPVGIIAGRSTKSGASQDINVKLLQDFNSLEYVTVVRNRKLKRIERLENIEDEKEGRR